jgi:hypothetical protein
MRSVRAVCLGSLLCVSCSGESPEPTTRLQQYLAGEIELEPGEAAELNAAFAESAVRGAGYADNAVEGGDPEHWSPVVRWQDGRWVAADVTPWIAAGDIDRNGRFVPCAKTACDESAAHPLIGAAARLDGAGTVDWSEGSRGIEFGPDGVLLNPRLVELLEQAAPAPALSAQSSLPVVVDAPPLRSHDPPPGYDDSSSSDCDCDDFVDFDCNNSSGSSSGGSSNNCAVSHSHRAPWFDLQSLLLVAALAWTLRRGARRESALRRLWHRVLTLTVPCLLLCASPAQAQSPEARASLEAGKKSLAAKDYTNAIAELERARQQGGGAAVLAPLAQAYEGAGWLPEAYVTLGELGPAGAERMQKLEPELAFVSAQVSPPNITLTVDGRPVVVDAKSKQIVVLPGKHVFSASAPGYATAQQPFQAERGTRNTVVTIVLAAPATLIVQGFAPDAIIAIDGAPVGQGQWTGSVNPGQHLVQVYKPGGPSYDFPINAASGQTLQLPPPAPRPRPVAVKPPPPKRDNRGLFVLGHLGFFALTARPEGFEYDLITRDDGTQAQGSGLMWWAGATAGYRLTRGVALGGLLAYGRGGGEGSITQVESVAGSYQTHTGPADFTLQFIRFGPHFRFMAGGDRARFLATVSLGASYQMVDLVHVDIADQGGVLVERGNYEHNETGVGPFWGFDLGAEFNPGDHMLLGVAFDFYLDRTNGISGDPYGGTAQGYVGFSARVGWHDWRHEP